jgi:hypothetical protein
VLRSSLSGREGGRYTNDQAALLLPGQCYAFNAFSGVTSTLIR